MWCEAAVDVQMLTWWQQACSGVPDAGRDKPCCITRSLSCVVSPKHKPCQGCWDCSALPRETRGIRGMELLSLRARAGAVWEGIVLPRVCTWARFSSSVMYKGVRWSSNLALCFAEPRELGRSILQWFCEGNLCLNDAAALSPCHLGRGNGSFGWSLLVRGVGMWGRKGSSGGLLGSSNPVSSAALE